MIMLRQPEPARRYIDGATMVVCTAAVRPGAIAAMISAAGG